MLIVISLIHGMLKGKGCHLQSLPSLYIDGHSAIKRGDFFFLKAVTTIYSLSLSDLLILLPTFIPSHYHHKINSPLTHCHHISLHHTNFITSPWHLFCRQPIALFAQPCYCSPSSPCCLPAKPLPNV